MLVRVEVGGLVLRGCVITESCAVQLLLSPYNYYFHLYFLKSHLSDSGLYEGQAPVRVFKPGFVLVSSMSVYCLQIHTLAEDDQFSGC